VGDAPDETGPEEMGGIASGPALACLHGSLQAGCLIGRPTFRGGGPPAGLPVASRHLAWFELALVDDDPVSAEPSV